MQISIQNAKGQRDPSLLSWDITLKIIVQPDNISAHSLRTGILVDKGFAVKYI